MLDRKMERRWDESVSCVDYPKAVNVAMTFQGGEVAACFAKCGYCMSDCSIDFLDTVENLVYGDHFLSMKPIHTCMAVYEVRRNYPEFILED